MRQVVFAYLGLSASDPRAWRGADWGFVALTLVGCVLGRCLNIFPLSALLNACRPPAARLPLRVQAVLAFAGLRGAIAFALALTFPGPSARDVASTTIVAAGAPHARRAHARARVAWCLHRAVCAPRRSADVAALGGRRR